MKLSKSILKSFKEKAVHHNHRQQSCQDNESNPFQQPGSPNVTLALLVWRTWPWPPLCRCFWRRLDGLDRQLLTLPRLSIRDLPPRACRGGNTNAAVIANPNQYKFCLASLHIPFLNSAQLDKGELLKEVHNAKKSYDFCILGVSNGPECVGEGWRLIRQ